VEPSPLILQPFIELLYQLWIIDGDDCGTTSEINGWQGKPTYSEKNSDAALVSVAPTCLHSTLKSGNCGGKPATNRMVYGIYGQTGGGGAKRRHGSA
jgi:hypothetical protein